MATQDHHYLGDGAYASHDGYHVWLAVNHHENNVIALDPDMLQALVNYARKIGLYREGTADGES